jgi:hypothetical protein
MNKNPFIPKEDRLMKYHDVVFSDFIASLFANKKEKPVSKKKNKKTIEEDPPLFI